MMMLTLDNLAHRYNCLPSEAMDRATTFDLRVLDVSAKWSKYQNDLAEGKVPLEKQYNLSKEQMLAAIQQARERDAERQHKN